MRDANVAISAVKYDRDRKHIEYVRVHLPAAGFIGPAVKDVRRETVADMIRRDGKTVITVYEEDGTWVDGAEVVSRRTGSSGRRPTTFRKTTWVSCPRSTPPASGCNLNRRRLEAVPGLRCVAGSGA